jgi:hypothetical protein
MLIFKLCDMCNYVSLRLRCQGLKYKKNIVQVGFEDKRSYISHCQIPSVPSHIKNCFLDDCLKTWHSKAIMLSHRLNILPVFEVVDLTIPGWVASPKNVKRIVDSLNKMESSKGLMFVIEAFSTSTYRFEQSDGSTYLPYKSGRRCYLAGNVTVCSPSVFQKLITAIVPNLAAKKMQTAC